MSPYPPTKNMKNPGGIEFAVLHKMFNMLAIKLCGQQHYNCISLSKFGDDQRKCPEAPQIETGVPEPTPEGAKDLAELIRDRINK